MTVDPGPLQLLEIRQYFAKFCVFGVIREQVVVVVRRMETEDMRVSALRS